MVAPTVETEHLVCICLAAYAGRFCETDQNEQWLPALATMGLDAEMELMAILASVCLDTKAGIVTGKWMNLHLIPALMRPYASTR